MALVWQAGGWPLNWCNESLELKSRYCTATFSTLALYLNHMPQHRHITSSYPCGVQACKAILQDESCLRLHLIRQHSVKKTSFRSTPASNSSGKYVYSVSHCAMHGTSMEVDTRKQLNSHLSYHIQHGVQVPCPHRGCRVSYKKLNSFLNHLHKWHKPVLVEEDLVTPDNKNSDSASLPSVEDDALFLPLEVNVNAPVENTQRNLQVECLAQLFMKLEFELLVPESSVNYIATEVVAISQENYVTVEEDVRRNLQMKGVDPSAIESVSKAVFSPFKTQFQSLQSSYLRKQFY